MSNGFDLSREIRDKMIRSLSRNNLQLSAEIASRVWSIMIMIKKREESPHTTWLPGWREIRDRAVNDYFRNSDIIKG